MEKLQIEYNLKREKLSKKVIFLLGFFAIFLLVARVVIANRLVEVSSKLRDLDHQIEIIEKQNDQIAEEVRSRESLVSIESRAASLGFRSVRNLSYITSPEPVALGTLLTRPLR